MYRLFHEYQVKKLINYIPAGSKHQTKGTLTSLPTIGSGTVTCLPYMCEAIDTMQQESSKIPLKQKIKFEQNPTKWDHHHRGGWGRAFGTLGALCTPDGVLCVSSLEEWITDDRVIDEPWVGFVHQAPRSNYRHYPDLERFFDDGSYGECFRKSMDKCKGLFALSRTAKDYLSERISVPIACIFYPFTPFEEDKLFNWRKFELSEKKILFIGEYLRNYQAFYDLQVPPGHQKVLLKCPDVNYDKLFDCNRQPISLRRNDSVVVLDRVPDDEYDDLLCSSIVFLSVYDATSPTTVIECLARNTPIVVNRLPGITEYLGDGYPLLYDTLEEASALLGNKEMLIEATEYLQVHPIKAKLTYDHFLRSFASSSIYRSLPLPPSRKGDPQQTKFPQFDLTIVTCSYKRVDKMAELLRRFTQQDYTGTFELILWNNNVETQAQVEEICKPYMQVLNIRLIQSSENYYCIVRLAVSKLMRSNLLLICDDDVIPEKGYISTFVSKFKQYGPRVVLCCRGHVFSPHTLNEEEPQRVWDESEEWDNKILKFFDERVPDRQVREALFV